MSNSRGDSQDDLRTQSGLTKLSTRSLLAVLGLEGPEFNSDTGVFRIAGGYIHAYYPLNNGSVKLETGSSRCESAKSHKVMSRQKS